MITKRNTINTVILFLCSFIITGTAISKEYVLFTPNKYYEPIDGVNLSPTDDVRNGAPWVVFSDRNNNATYKEPGGGKTGYKAKYLEEFYVADESESYLKLVIDPDFRNEQKKAMKKGINSDEGMRFSNKAKVLGWIEKKKLLLWRASLEAPKNRIPRRAVTLSTVDMGELRNIDRLKSDVVKFYKSPDFVQESEMESNLYQVFYVYKKTKTAVLLGKEQTFDISSKSKIVWGWVDIKRLTMWNHRIAVEPNWDSEAAKERKASNKKAMFFVDYAKAIKYSDGQNVLGRDIYWNSDPFEKRQIGEWRRFPVLECTSCPDGIFGASIMGSITGRDSQQIDDFDAAILSSKFSKLRDRLRNINIVFVIDGTTSMGPYFNSLSFAIENSMKTLKDKYGDINGKLKNTIKYGAVVYRDYNEGIMRRVETCPLSTHKNVFQFLKGIDAKDYKDIDQPEAVRYGMLEALKSLGLDLSSQNMIVLIGDAGNHHRSDETQVSQNAVVNKLAYLGCNLLVLQVHHQDHAGNTYDEFIIDAKEIALKSAQKQYQLYGLDKSNAASGNNSEMGPPRIISEGDSYLIKGPVVSKVVPAPKNNSVEPLVIQNEIEDFIGFCYDHSEKLISFLDDVFENGKSVSAALESIEEPSNNRGNKYVDGYTSIVEGYINDILQDISGDHRQLMRGEKCQFSLGAYAPMNIKGQKYPLFQYVLLLDQGEASNLVNMMSKLRTSRSSTKQREDMQNAWIEILRDHLGDLSDADMMGKNLKDLNEKAFGLPGTSQLLKDVKLIHITDPNIVSDYDFQEYVERISEKAGELRDIINTVGYKYSFRSHDKTYYWIAQDMLP